ncbi:MAG TPA: RimK family alpha-L-glutamate ligase [Flavilitoribacter sp.]|nr:RimK family alpha-L-glutamate ligase [Flavilitoribacter sp.]
MRMAILSRGPQLYSTQSLYRAGRQRGHIVYVIDHTQCSLFLEEGSPRVYFEGRSLDNFDVIIPRIGASVTTQGAAVISQFGLMGVPSTAKPDALLEARDKLRCLQKLSTHGLPIPRSIYVGDNPNILQLTAMVGGTPVVVKQLESTHGIGVILCESEASTEATVEAFHRLRERVIMQEFIREADSVDIRALMVDGEVVASMRRQAKEGEFRSNLHRGATATPYQLTEEEHELVREAVRVMDLDVAGVDLLPSSRGPLIMEVNASPGLEGIETITGVNIAAKIIRLAEQKGRRN